MTPPSSIAATLDLQAWLGADPAWRSLPPAWRWGHAWRAAWGSLNARLSAAVADSAHDQPLRDPLLIAGPWRSGTTVMHELLAAASGCATPRTWQCMNACAFQLQPHAPRAGAMARPMDGLEIRPDSPQEDEFALLTLGVPSAYRTFLMPHRIAELMPTIDPAYWAADTAWLVPWERFLRGVLRTGGQARQPLILKSPSHTYRLPAILKRFPATRVVWMARPAAEVFLSNRQMWRTMIDAYGLTPPDLTALDTFLARALQAASGMLDWCEAQLPTGQWFMVRQQQLLAQPEQTLNASWARLGFDAPPDRIALSAAIDRNDIGHVSARPPQALPADAAAAARRLDATVERLWPRHGMA